jgi:PPOX class probable FMN-dependent enzyme
MTTTGAAGLAAAATITSVAELREVLGEPTEAAATKDRMSLHQRDREWLAQSGFVLIATAGIDGSCDVSPKGDPAGFTLVLDDTTIVLPDRPGNRRADGFRNILGNPHVGLIYLIPGRGDTLRINGRATLVRDAPFFDDLVVQGKRPNLAMVVEIDEVFYHCSKAFLRSSLWDPQTWDPQSVPSRAVISHSVERQNQSLADVENYYSPENYARELY